MPHSESQINMRSLCLDILFKPIDFIHAKCLIECQFRLGKVRPSPRVSFWFTSLVIMCLMDSRSYNNFLVVAGIIGLKSALNSLDSRTGLLEIVPR